MRCDSDIICRERSVKSRNTLLLRHLPEAIHHSTIRQLPIRSLRLFLQSSLNEVKGQRHRRGKESCNCRSGQSLSLGAHIGALETGLGFGEECELTKVQSHGAHDGGRGAGPETDDTFVLNDAPECREDGGVVFALCQWLQTICRLSVLHFLVPLLLSPA